VLWELFEYSQRFPGAGASNDSAWGCRERQISAFSLTIFSDTLEMRPALLYVVLVGFSVIPKAKMHDLEWPWRAISDFAPVWLADTVRLRKVIAWKLIKTGTYCQQFKSSVGTLVSDNKVCADIRSGSLERRRRRTVGSRVNARPEHLFLGF